MATFTEKIFDRYDQIVIYGANGWLGRSCLDLFAEIDPKMHSRMILVGSKPSTVHLNSVSFQIDTSSTIEPKLSNNLVFLNAAYLRREKLNFMSPQKYLNSIEEIESFPVRMLKNKKVATFLNLSSGVAKKYDGSSQKENEDLYAYSKKQSEIRFRTFQRELPFSLINCRIYSITGRHINEFENLAISSFINQAKGESSSILVNSPDTRRTYLDATLLVQTLLELAISEPTYSELDSGGELVSLERLAQSVAKYFGISVLGKPKNSTNSPDYYGDFEGFNRLAADLGISLTDLDAQVAKTIEAFNF